MQAASPAHDRRNDSGRPMSFRGEPRTGALGAEILGIGVSRDLDDLTVRALREALLEHGFIFFRDQSMFANQYLAYETLSPGLKKMLDGVRAWRSDRRVAGPARDLGASNAKKAKSGNRCTQHIASTSPASSGG